MERLELTPRIRPPFDTLDAVRAARELWDVQGTATVLPGDRDRNFRIASDGGDYVLKFVYEDDPIELTELQLRAMTAAKQAREDLHFPVPQPTTGGALLARFPSPDGTLYRVLMMSWLEGIPYADFRPHTADLLRRIGRGLAGLDLWLAAIEPVPAEEDFEWDVRNAPKTVDRLLDQIDSAADRGLVARHMERFSSVTDVLKALPVQLIHGDANDYNVIVRAPDAGALGLIDFGDLGASWRAAEVAVAGAYLAMGAEDPVAAWQHVTAGYHERSPLSDSEIFAIPYLVAARLCLSVCHSALRARTEPGDDYQTISQNAAWTLLRRLDQIHPRLAGYRLREACGMEPCPASLHVGSWLEASHPAPVLAIPLRGPVFDLSVGTVEFDGGLDPTNASVWTEPFAERMQAQSAGMAFGRYLEPRICYRAEQFASGGAGPERQRTIHLGIDLFAPAGTGVQAPYTAEVVSVIDHNQPLDYGPTVILRHEYKRGIFWTLYGHLARGVLDRLKPGMTLGAGERFAELGLAHENGGWPPHLHFQVFLDDFDTSGNLPGVAFASQQRTWRSVCPDPNLILRSGVPLTYDADGVDTLESRRGERMGSNLSLSYQDSLHIVRGIGVHLFDAEGRAYLDCVNNVCHLGHTHPAVVRAASRQLSVLNTNTRYLHRNVLDYGDRLTATLPEGLDVCFLVNSGSEANDLALRLVGAATGRTGTIVVEGGYHGNLTSLIAISPYKFDGPGGRGAPAHVAKACMPDPYRNPGGTAQDFARDISRAAGDLEQRGKPPGAFIAESILSCGGQIVPPPGYMAEAYKRARKAGALCIADEVQTGFGRVGHHMWAFELHGVVPDIVTMGKPIGNGFPLGAVVTTRAIADAFADGMEYFNTYGGNPVSSAVGLAVLETIQAEGLQERALMVGTHLKRRLEALADQHPLIDDIRGEGLFLGFEMVTDPTTKAPAAEEASYVVNRMKGMGVLLSTDGPLHNVIKIKPPLVFSEADADELADKLAIVLTDTRLNIR